METIQLILSRSNVQSVEVTNSMIIIRSGNNQIHRYSLGYFNEHILPKLTSKWGGFWGILPAKEVQFNLYKSSILTYKWSEPVLVTSCSTGKRLNLWQLEQTAYFIYLLYIVHIYYIYYICQLKRFNLIFRSQLTVSLYGHSDVRINRRLLLQNRCADGI